VQYYKLSYGVSYYCIGIIMHFVDPANSQQKVLATFAKIQYSKKVTTEV
jgi:hypothetical protein